MRKIIKGGADKSYGIQVARLAGVPDEVLIRAKELVEELSAADISATVGEIASSVNKEPVYEQFSLFAEPTDAHITEEIEKADLSVMTPIEALNMLYRLQNDIKSKGYGR